MRIEKWDLGLANVVILEKIVLILEIWVVDSYFQDKFEYTKNQDFLSWWPLEVPAKEESYYTFNLTKHDSFYV